MRGLIRRAAVAAGAAVVLLGPAAGAAASASASVPGWSITPSPNPLARNGLLNFLVEVAVTVHHGTAFVFASQKPTGITPTDQPSDRAAFGEFLAGIGLRR